MKQELSPLVEKLKLQLEAFKYWEAQLQTKEADWETYLNWPEVYIIIEEILHIISSKDLEQPISELILFFLVRDNEVENILDTLVQFPLHLLELAETALTYDDYEARWQIASALGRIASQDLGNEIDKILLTFTNDEDEYVRRRALLALGYRKSKFTEQVALAAWKTGLTYQKIAALYALNEISYSGLATLLEAAKNDPDKYVQEAAFNVENRNFEASS